jgi:filamentous hemagglutinin family protein
MTPTHSLVGTLREPQERFSHPAKRQNLLALRIRLAATAATGLGTMLVSSANAQTATPLPTALPTGGQVSVGSASIEQGSAVMVVRQQTSKAAINWQTFNVGKDAEVQFLQPDKNSVTLNRVLSTDPSQIFGKIMANGQVILTNPFGVLFSKDARVDVGGLTATTHGIGDRDFMSGNLRFTRNGSTGSVINQGVLTAADGGYVALLAPEVRNEGLISARLGTAALAAGEAFELQFSPDNRLANIQVEAADLASLVENRHVLLTPGGTIIMTASSLEKLFGGVVRNNGEIAANGLQERAGRILLTASQGITNDGAILALAAAGGAKPGAIEVTTRAFLNSGRLSAAGGDGTISISVNDFTQVASGGVDLTGPNGGSLALNAAGNVNLAGSINAGSAADSANGRGGSIRILAGATIDLNSASINAGGGSGGTIQILAGRAADPGHGEDNGPTGARSQVNSLGTTNLATNGIGGRGGSIQILADSIELGGESKLTATGATGGGSILVGGDWQGGGGLYQASRVLTGSGVTLDASAIASGDGGKIVLWSRLDDPLGYTKVKGSLVANGGSKSGDGGAIETSGANLEIGGARISARAPNGGAGHWLLDPYDYACCRR